MACGVSEAAAFYRIILGIARITSWPTDMFRRLTGGVAARIGRGMSSLEWQIAPSPVDYNGAVASMEARVAAIRGGTAPELVWLLEHPSLYTAGTSAREEDLLDPAGLPVFASGRGGQYTYHGPGQRIAYVMLDLERRGRDLRRYVADLEAWLILTLSRFNLRGERRDGRVGIWIAHEDGSEHKIAAIGVRVRRWVTFHGISLNVEPDLARYAGIVPCGISRHGVTSLAAEGILVSMHEVDIELRASFHRVFG
jgi:lipoyl(octanoyl) transferase